jgi:hypothetical protein
VDQRLFAAQQEPVTTPAQQPSQLPSQEASKEVSQEAVREPSQPVSQEPRRALSLAQEPLRKNSFLFTMEEWEALEDLLLDLRRKHALDVTKNDLARCALHVLVEDYERRGEASLVLKKLRGR